jgi:hypothetical protein
MTQSRKKLGWLHISVYIKTQAIKITSASSPVKAKCQNRKKKECAGAISTQIYVTTNTPALWNKTHYFAFCGSWVTCFKPKKRRGMGYRKVRV